MNDTKNHLFCTSNTLDQPSLPPFKIINSQDLKFIITKVIYTKWRTGSLAG